MRERDKALSCKRDMSPFTMNTINKWLTACKNWQDRVELKMLTLLMTNKINGFQH